MLQLTSAGGTYPVQTSPGAAAALVLTAWSARRGQVWSVKRLHPELSP